MSGNDTYRTLAKASEEVLYKDRNSKFYGYAFPVSSEDEVKILLGEIKKSHHSARHWCYAYQLGEHEHNRSYRVNDDGEPSNSAGMPIYGQLQSFEVTNVLLVVVRYFGGTKLGVGGLIKAYKTTAQLALEASEIITKTIMVRYRIGFEYKHMNKVMRLIKEKNLDVIDQVLELDCQITIAVRSKEAMAIFELFTAFHEITINEMND